ncbi:hypothetical protein [Chryseobacterium sp. 22458]|uniref:hypothetical protein n=1 Tax=Chryseobacterium sp. 22458 TaxID=3453921 RepID=UPI003F82A6ED
MKVHYLYLLLFLFSCHQKENFISDFSKKNNVQLINLSEEVIPVKSVVDEFDDGFLEKYNFSKETGTYDNQLDLQKIDFIKKDNNEHTRISVPFFSIDKKYCLIQVNTYLQDIRNSNVIYLLKNDKGIWKTEERMESSLVD